MIPYGNARATAESPATNHYAITPDDVAEIGAFTPRAVYVGTGGTLVGRAYGATADVTFLNIPNGTVLPVSLQFIRSTGSTVGGLVALL